MKHFVSIIGTARPGTHVGHDSIHKQSGIVRSTLGAAGEQEPREQHMAERRRLFDVDDLSGDFLPVLVSRVEGCHGGIARERVD